MTNKPVEDVVESGAPAQPSSGEGATAQKESDLYASLEGSIKDALREHFAGVDRIVTKDRERTAVLETAVSTLMEGTRGIKSLLERVAQNTLTEEDWSSIQQEALKNRAESAEAENIALKTKPEPKPDPQADAEALLVFELQRYHVPALRRYAEKRGVKLEEAGLLNDKGQWVIQRGPEGKNPNDPYGWGLFLADAEKLIDVAADKIGLVKTPAVEIDDTRPGGVSTGGVAARYQAWLEGKGPKPPSAEIDALTRPYLTRT